MREMKGTKKANQSENQVGNQVGSQVGRRPVFRWPGLELTSDFGSGASTPAPATLTAPHTRQQELALAEKEAATREEKYGGEAYLFDLKFDVGPDGPHTTIDFDKWERSVYGKSGDDGNNGYDNDYDKGDVKGGGFATVTTSDFLIYNKIKRLMKQGESDGVGENTESPPIEIVDLKFSQTGRTVYFVTAKVPIKFLKKLLQNS